ncbi:PIG-L family deacetylase [Marivita sp. S2033]|uniref:PIG-L family deacetylase n=1 Tax=Marivita sp. S2033 TaxID=3373187 RepID=UPI00398207CE
MREPSVAIAARLTDPEIVPDAARYAMSTPDQTRLNETRMRPRVLDLWWALRPLTSVVRLMNSGAHPDDETTALLAAVALRDGISLSYACSTRGEGGQNDIGTENGPALGALRTREMERACDLLNMRLYWLGTSPDDTITDFRFSKSGDETMEIWDRDHLLHRFVEIIRIDRPDILLPTFLDVPGQHGHHRAMTQAAIEVMQAAADPEFSSNLPVWQISKLYLPAWSGAGQAYDDDLPPPETTLTVDGAGKDPVSGWSYARIGQMSRAAHRTQGMGRWVPAGPGPDWPLHLAQTHVSGPDTALTSGLPQTLADLVELAPDLREDLLAAHGYITETVSAFPNFTHMAATAQTALRHVQRVLDDCPPEIEHRLSDKETQLSHVLRLALGIEASAHTDATWLRPGDSTPLTVEFDPGDAADATLTLDLPVGWQHEDDELTTTRAANVTDPYRTEYDPANPPAPCLSLTFGTTSVALPMREPPVMLPDRVAFMAPDSALVNLNTDQRALTIAIGDVSPAGNKVTFDLPENWKSDVCEGGVRVTLPKDTAPGLYTLPLFVGPYPAMTERRIAYEHIDPTAFANPAALRVRVLDVAVPEGKVGYIGSGHDGVAHWLSAMGADVTDLTDDQINSERALAEFDTIVIGIFALRFRDGLVSEMPRLHTWVRDGGTLLTLYHRPCDNWDPDAVPPERLEIGQPSLRWRVTDAQAEVTQLQYHPILQTPNEITADDWEGWVKERGLYFAKSWDAAFVPLLSMSDPEEEPLKGALVTAEIGKGRHTHCSLILHHQMANLVPGAFRLMANLIAPRT